MKIRVKAKVTGAERFGRTASLGLHDHHKPLMVYV
jgi:hypothetical protein